MAALPDKKRFSKLYCTYNGFMLGHFLLVARLRFCADRYQVLRNRIQEFLDEMGAKFALPDTYEKFNDKYDEITMPVIQSVMSRSQEVAKTAYIGWAATFIAASPDDPSAEELKHQVSDFLSEYGVALEALDRFIEKVPSKQEWTKAEDLLTPALGFLCEIIGPMEQEIDTCFVAMPFREPFSDYFHTFYRPMLENSGYRALRAWGGFSREDFVDVIILLIRRSGAILAELTGLNLNVMYEAGIALGGNSDVFWIAQGKDDFEPPSDLAQDMILTYSPDAEGWLVRDLEMCTMNLLAARVALENKI
jgi:hypothetical protein